MTSQGSPYARFNRAILTKNMNLIEAAARELDHVSVEDALRILVVMAAKHDRRFERAGAKWTARVAAERRLDLDQTRRILSLVEVLPSAPDAVAVKLRALSAQRR